MLEVLQNYMDAINGATRLTQRNATAMARNILSQAGMEPAADMVHQLSEQMIAAQEAQYAMIRRMIQSELSLTMERMGMALPAVGPGQEAPVKEQLGQDEPVKEAPVKEELVQDEPVTLEHPPAAPVEEAAQEAVVEAAATTATVTKSSATNAPAMAAPATKAETATSTPAVKAAPAKASPATKAAPAQASPTTKSAPATKAAPVKKAPARKVAAKKAPVRRVAAKKAVGTEPPKPTDENASS